MHEKKKNGFFKLFTKKDNEEFRKNKILNNHKNKTENSFSWRLIINRNILLHMCK